jgi:phage/plasmid-like protein (TIGR03299 family)
MGIDKYNRLGGVETMVASRFTPWHGLGTVTQDRLTDAFDAARMAGIDWQVNEIMLSDIIPNPLADEHKLRVRATDGAILGVGSPRYGLIQNESIARLAQEIINFRPDAHIEATGALFHGKVVWCLIALDDEAASLSGGEKMFRYLLVYTSHDGSKPFAVRFTNVRVQCMNTMSMAMGKANELLHTVRHTSNALAYVKEAEDSVKAAVQTFDLMDMEIEALLAAEMPKAQAMGMFKQILGEPTDSKRGQTLWEAAFDGIVNEYNADFNANIKGTAWGAVMAVNGYELWSQNARGQTKGEKQFKHLLDGRYPLTAKAFDLAAVG